MHIIHCEGKACVNVSKLLRDSKWTVFFCPQELTMKSKDIGMLI